MTRKNKSQKLLSYKNKGQIENYNVISYEKAWVKENVVKIILSCETKKLPYQVSLN